MDLHNTYEDQLRATAYNELDLGGTYELVFRNLPGLLRQHAQGNRALDFGCGTGRSTRFLQGLGFSTTGVDISAEMVEFARQHEPGGNYRVIEDGNFQSLPVGEYDLVQSAFTFDNISGRERRARILGGLGKLLADGGILVNIVSTPDIYRHEWVTFSTRDFPENAHARGGDVVKIVTTDYSDARPVEDVLWTHEDYLQLFEASGLEMVSVERPLAVGDEGIAWKSETQIAPWAIYILKKSL